ncbi:hypothetical protein U1701_00400 [Sphingomonas sp. PB2P19]|uniref:hypothetical protein n=1 Tax=Sphingomonas rhamnosi TaxID=3096156 RepID=UPI002FC95340
MNTDSQNPRGPAFATVPGTDYASDYGTDAPPTGATAIPTTFLPGDDEDDTLHVSRRHDGWSAANQRHFLEALAEGHGVDVAARRVGLSAASAYAFRRTAKGAAFALGWRAAAIVAREAIAETLLVRALEGTVDTIVRGETVITRHKYDNRLALSLLARLDRQAETATDCDAKAARLVAQEFDAYLDLVGQDASPARAGLFLARRAGVFGDGPEAGEGADLTPLYALAAADRFVRTGVATAGEVDIADLDPAARASWTAEQWARAEAAGLIAIAAPAPEPTDAQETTPAPQHSQHSRDPDMPLVWQLPETDAWRTSFPPPEDFDGFEQGEFGDYRYERELDAYEQGCMDVSRAVEVDARRREEGAERDAFFAELLATIDDPDVADLLAEFAEQGQQETVELAQQPGSDDDQSDPPTA